MNYTSKHGSLYLYPDMKNYAVGRKSNLGGAFNAKLKGPTYQRNEPLYFRNTRSKSMMGGYETFGQERQLRTIQHGVDVMKSKPTILKPV